MCISERRKRYHVVLLLAHWQRSKDKLSKEDLNFITRVWAVASTRKSTLPTSVVLSLRQSGGLTAERACARRSRGKRQRRGRLRQGDNMTHRARGPTQRKFEYLVACSRVHAEIHFLVNMRFSATWIPSGGWSFFESPPEGRRIGQCRSRWYACVALWNRGYSACSHCPYQALPGSAHAVRKAPATADSLELKCGTGGTRLRFTSTKPNISTSSSVAD